MKVHFIGIGGIGVSALAQYYLARGEQVSGSDLAFSEITEFLKKLGAQIFTGPHKAKNIPNNVDLVIYSPAVKPDNPELKKAKNLKPEHSNRFECSAEHKRKSFVLWSNIQHPPKQNKFATGQAISNIQIQSYPEALGELTKKYFTIAISGTHGKSTTTAMLAKILIKAGLDPTIIIGTKLKEFGNSNFRMGRKLFRGVPRTVPRGSAILLIEADEHFGSFLNYWPKIIVLTNIEEDHLDYYKNLKNILRTFRKYVSYLPKDGFLVANRDDKNIQRILNPKSKTLISKPKIAEQSSLRGRQIPNSKFQIPKIIYYSIKQKEAKKLKQILKVPGEHNVYNALSALTVARILKISDKTSLKALSGYKGAWRRFEVEELKIVPPQPRRSPATAGSRNMRDGIPQITPTADSAKGGNAGRDPARGGKSCKLKIISDYAHHPTEIRATLKAAMEKYPGKKIWCVYQPHQYQRTFYLFKDFVEVFADAIRFNWVDKLILVEIYDVAGREEKKIKKKISSEKLVEVIRAELRKSVKNVLYIKSIGEAEKYLKKNLRGGEVVIVMGAGDIYKLCEQF